MRKKILISLALLGALAVFVSLGSYAWFSDLETSTGNTFTAGTIDLWVDGQSRWNKSYTVTMPDGDAFLKPCQVGYIEFPVQNRGNNPADVWKMVQDTSSTENGITEPEQSHYNHRPGSENKDIEDYLDFDLTVIRDTSPQVDVIIPENDPKPITTVDGYWIYLGRLEPGESMIVKQSFHLRVDTDSISSLTGLPDMNWAQSDQKNFNERIFGLQVTGAHSPSPELPGYGRITCDSCH